MTHLDSIRLVRPMRTRRGALQTAALTYRSRHDGQEVTLVGMVHVGTADYYRYIEDLIAQRPDATVVYEMVADHSEGGTTAEGAILQRLAECNLASPLADMLGLERQHKPHPRIQPDWINADMTTLELVRQMPDAHRWIAGMEKAQAALSEHQLEAAFSWALRHTPLLSRALGALEQLTPTGRARRRVLIHQRNQIALAAIGAAKGDVIALWGAAHLPGLARGLRDRSFALAWRDWLTAVPAPAERPTGRDA